MRSSGVVAAAILLAACGGPSPAQRAASLADAATQALYADEPGQVSAHFDAPIAGRVSRAQVGAISDKMHALGDYHGLREVGGVLRRNEYTFEAQFGRGVMIVVVRVGDDGKLAAYRIIPPRGR